MAAETSCFSFTTKRRTHHLYLSRIVAREPKTARGLSLKERGPPLSRYQRPAAVLIGASLSKFQELKVSTL